MRGWSDLREGKQGRNRSCLEQEDLARRIDGPLDVLGSLIQRFDSCPKRCQCSDLIIRETGPRGRRACFDLLDATSSRSLDQHLLVAQAALDNLARGGLHHKMIGVGRAGNDGLTQAGIGIDHDLSTFPGEWIGREEEASYLSLHDAVHHDAQAYVPRS